MELLQIENQTAVLGDGGRIVDSRVMRLSIRITLQTLLLNHLHCVAIMVAFAPTAVSPREMD